MRKNTPPQNRSKERRVATPEIKGAWLIKVPKLLSTEWQGMKDQVVGIILVEQELFRPTTGNTFLVKSVDQLAAPKYVVIDESKSTRDLVAMGNVCVNATFVPESLEQCVKAAVDEINKSDHLERRTKKYDDTAGGGRNR